MLINTLITYIKSLNLDKRRTLNIILEKDNTYLNSCVLLSNSLLIVTDITTYKAIKPTMELQKIGYLSLKLLTILKAKNIIDVRFFKDYQYLEFNKANCFDCTAIISNTNFNELILKKI